MKTKRSRKALARILRNKQKLVPTNTQPSITDEELLERRFNRFLEWYETHLETIRPTTWYAMTRDVRG